jgi:electron transport complex protein RnfC
MGINSYGQGGIQPQKFKELTKDRPIIKAKIPSKVVIPLSQHIGADCVAKVRVGDKVKVGTLIGEGEAKLSSNIHASISGVVREITKYPHPLKGKGKAVVIEGDGRDEKESHLERKEEDLNSFSLEEILRIIRNAGIVGLGGACFPTHIKLTPPKKVEVVILNGAECEPYLTCDYRLMVERPTEVLKGLKIVLSLLEVKKAFIGIEDDKPRAVKAMEEASHSELTTLGGSKKLDIKVVTLKTRYPQGGEKQLIKAILKREVPSGGLPFDIGVIVQNVGTAFAIYEAVYKNKPLYERIVTVTGKAINRPANLLLRIGTPISNLIDECGGLATKLYKVIVGGPMMGVAQYSLEVPVIKGTSGVLFFSEGEANEPEDSVCIKCARCCEACPVYLLPFQIARLARKGRWSELERYNVEDCIECGCCDYVCPAKIPLVQLIKLGKANKNKD